MKISMLLTSLLVAMSASHLNASENADKSKQKTSDSMKQSKSNDAIENSEAFEDPAIEVIPPDTKKH